MDDLSFFDEDEVKTVECVVQTEKIIHQGRLHGHVTGGGVIDIGNNYGLKFVVMNENFVTIQLLDSGCGAKIKNQSYQRAAKIIKPKKKPIQKAEKKSVSEIKQKELL